MNKVVFGPAARAELLEAVAWYKALAPSLAARLVTEVEASIVRIAQSPLIHPVIYKDVRCARLRLFPYALFFRIESERIYVLACFHSNRDPQRWRKRT